MDKGLYELLQKESKSKGASLNSLVNSILKRYVSWEKYADEIGFIPLAKETIKLIFDNLDDRKIKEIAHRLGKTIPREFILLMFNRIDFNSIVSFIEITSSRYGMVQHNITRDIHDLIIYHNVNERFSKFLAEAAKAMADDLSVNLEVVLADSKILSIRIKEINDS